MKFYLSPRYMKNATNFGSELLTGRMQSFNLARQYGWGYYFGSVFPRLRALTSYLSQHRERFSLIKSFQDFSNVCKGGVCFHIFRFTNARCPEFVAALAVFPYDIKNQSDTKVEWERLWK